MPKTKAIRTKESSNSSKILQIDIPKIPNKPLLKYFQEFNENFSQILTKQQLSKGFSLIDSTGSEYQYFIEGDEIPVELNLKCLSKRFPKALKVSKEARFEFSGLPGMKLLYQLEMLAHLSTVKSLKLTWNWQRWKCEKYLQHVCEALKRMKHLESLDFTLSDFQGVNVRVFKRLIKALKTLGSLRKVTLNLKMSSLMTDEWVLYLSEGLRRIRTLKHIDFNFDDCKKLDKGLEYLSKSFKKLPHLESLKLNFRWCMYIPDDGFKILGESLQGLNKLTKVDLDFTGCWLVRDEGLSGLFKGLSRAESLEDIKIQFNRCDYVTDRALTAIEEEIQLFTSLKKIHLGLQRCRKMTPKGLDELYESLLRFPGIQFAHVSR